MMRSASLHANRAELPANKDASQAIAVPRYKMDWAFACAIPYEKMPKSAVPCWAFVKARIFASAKPTNRRRIAARSVHRLWIAAAAINALASQAARAKFV